MRRSTQTFALIASLALGAAGFEGLAQNANSTRQLRVNNQQKQMERYHSQDPVQIAKGGQKNAKGNKSGPADGSGNKGNRPQDGTGYGANSGKRTGPQDGTGPGCTPGGRNNGGRGKGSRGGRN